MEKIRILIADDQLLFRSMLQEMLEKEDGFEIVATCSNGEQAIEKALALKPHVALLDIGMPVKSGIEALEQIKAKEPQIKVALLTTFEDDEKIQLALKHGADGYLVKELEPHVLRMAVTCLYHDIVVFHRGVYATLLHKGLMNTKPSDNRLEIGDMVFDAIDVSIMGYIASGKSNKDIATLLHYSEGTIKNRVSKILATTGFSDRTEISVFAVKNHII